MREKQGIQGWVDGPWGLRLPAVQARALERCRRELPVEFREELLRRTIGQNPGPMGDREEDSWITTDQVDRQGDVVLPGGMDDSLFALNPVVTWQHAYDQPAVGVSLWRRLADRPVGQGIIARTRYPPRPPDLPAGEPWLPDQVLNLARQGLLRAKSIGFVPVRARGPTAEEIRSRPDWSGARRVITAWLLVEYACVTLPANPHTLLVRQSGAADLVATAHRLGDLLFTRQMQAIDPKDGRKNHV